MRPAPRIRLSFACLVVIWLIASAVADPDTTNGVSTAPQPCTPALPNATAWVDATIAMHSCRTHDARATWTWCIDPVPSSKGVGNQVCVSPQLDNPGLRTATAALFRKHVEQVLTQLVRDKLDDVVIAPRNLLNQNEDQSAADLISINVALPLPPNGPGEIASRPVTYHSLFTVVSGAKYTFTSNDNKAAQCVIDTSLYQVRERFGMSISDADHHVPVHISISLADIASASTPAAAIEQAARLVADTSEILRRRSLVAPGMSTNMLDAAGGEALRQLQSIHNLPTTSALPTAFQLQINAADDPKTTSQSMPANDSKPLNQLTCQTAVQPAATMKPGDASTIAALAHVKLTGSYVHNVVIGEDSNDSAIAAVRRRYQCRFDRDLRGTIPRGMPIAEALYDLGHDPYVAAQPGEPVALNTNELDFAVTTRHLLQSILITPGATYSPDKGFAATGTFNASNLARLNDSWTTSIAGGPHTFDTLVGWQLPEVAARFRAWRPHFLGGGVSGGYSFNNKKHFGVTDLSTEHQSSINGNLTYAFYPFDQLEHLYAFDTSAPARPRSWHMFTVKPAFEVAFLGADAQQFARTAQRGQVSYVSIAPTYRFTRDLQPAKGTRGLHDVSFETGMNLGKAERHLGGDFAYDFAEATGMLESRFGFKDTREFLLRGTAGATGVSLGAPIERLVQPGGGDYIRGLEKGEVLAHSLLWQQGTAGISFSGIWARVHHAKKDTQPNSTPTPHTTTPDAPGASVGTDDGAANSTATSETGAGSDRTASDANDAPEASTAPHLPFNLAESYLTTFFDHGWSSDSTSFVRTLHSGRSLDSFGVAAELDHLAAHFDVTIGYGFSPQSRLHSHGLVFTTLRFRF